MLERLLKNLIFQLKSSNKIKIFFSEFIFENVNNMIARDIYPEQLKWAHVKPAHKKGSRTDKENFRPVSIYERCLFKQLTNYFEDLFSKYQCGFRKGFSKTFWY